MASRVTVDRLISGSLAPRKALCRNTARRTWSGSIVETNSLPVPEVSKGRTSPTLTCRRTRCVEGMMWM
ncbi:Uncharacterised protein [Bordetella pertussis]|nr:Uncharacterised protein [Bordetella pertussis]CPN31138.1 Uncharacterised protein [Bordetella pertussis]